MNPQPCLPEHAWSRFVHLLVNVPRRFEMERPGLRGISRQGTMAFVLFAVASGRPRLSVPVSAVPDFRLGVLAELVECGELVRCTSERGRAHVAPAILLEAVAQLDPRVRDPLVSGDPVASAWSGWLRNAPTPRPLTEIASDVLAHADEAGELDRVAERLGAVAVAFGLTSVAALVRGTASVRSRPGQRPVSGSDDRAGARP